MEEVRLRQPGTPEVNNSRVSLGRRMWNESKKIWRVAFPAILIRVTMYAAMVITQACMGHVSKLDLAAYALVQTISVRFSNGLLLGMSSATETLCGQAFGAEQYHMLGIYLQRSWIINLVAATMMVPLYVFAAPMYRLIGQEEAIAKETGRISLWFIPFMYQNAILMPTQRFLQAQSKNNIVGWISLVSLVVHVFASWTFVSKLDLGVSGAMGAFILSSWLIVGGQFVYLFGGWCPKTWTGFSMAALVDLWRVTKLSISSGIMICLEVWYTAVLVLIAGYMKDAVTAISAFSICLNIIQLAFMVSWGFLSATSVRVSNELGRGDAKAAKFSIKAILITATSIGVIFWILALVFGQYIGHIFTSNTTIIKAVASLTWFLAFSVLLNSFQPALSGVAVGSGRQSTVAYINICSYYVIGVPLGLLLAYLGHLSIKGIWIGMMAGVAVQIVVLGYVTWTTDWDAQVNLASERLQKLFIRRSKDQAQVQDQA